MDDRNYENLVDVDLDSLVEENSRLHEVYGECEKSGEIDQSDLVQEFSHKSPDLVEEENLVEFSLDQENPQEILESSAKIDTHSAPIPLAQEEDEWEECEDEEKVVFWWYFLVGMIALSVVVLIFYFWRKFRERQATAARDESREVSIANGSPAKTEKVKHKIIVTDEKGESVVIPQTPSPISATGQQELLFSSEENHLPSGEEKIFDQKIEVKPANGDVSESTITLKNNQQVSSSVASKDEVEKHEQKIVMKSADNVDNVTVGKVVQSASKNVNQTHTDNETKDNVTEADYHANANEDFTVYAKPDENQSVKPSTGNAEVKPQISTRDEINSDIVIPALLDNTGSVIVKDTEKPMGTVPESTEVKANKLYDTVEERKDVTQTPTKEIIKPDDYSSSEEYSESGTYELKGGKPLQKSITSLKSEKDKPEDAKNIIDNVEVSNVVTTDSSQLQNNDLQPTIEQTKPATFDTEKVALKTTGQEQLISTETKDSAEEVSKVVIDETNEQHEQNLAIKNETKDIITPRNENRESSSEEYTDSEQFPQYEIVPKDVKETMTKNTETSYGKIQQSAIDTKGQHNAVSNININLTEITPIDQQQNQVQAKEAIDENLNSKDKETETVQQQATLNEDAIIFSDLNSHIANGDIIPKEHEIVAEKIQLDNENLLLHDSQENSPTPNVADIKNVADIEKVLTEMHEDSLPKVEKQDSIISEKTAASLDIHNQDNQNNLIEKQTISEITNAETVASSLETVAVNDNLFAENEVQKDMILTNANVHNKIEKPAQDINISKDTTVSQDELSENQKKNDDTVTEEYEKSAPIFSDVKNEAVEVNQNAELISESGIEHIVDSSKVAVAAESEKVESDKSTEIGKEIKGKPKVTPEVVKQKEDVNISNENLKSAPDDKQSKELISESGIEHIVDSSKVAVAAESEKVENDKSTEIGKEVKGEPKVTAEVVKQKEDVNISNENLISAPDDKQSKEFISESGIERIVDSSKVAVAAESEKVESDKSTEIGKEIKGEPKVTPEVVKQKDDVNISNENLKSAPDDEQSKELIYESGIEDNIESRKLGEQENIKSDKLPQKDNKITGEQKVISDVVKQKDTKDSANVPTENLKSISDETQNKELISESGIIESSKHITSGELETFKSDELHEQTKDEPKLALDIVEQKDGASIPIQKLKVTAEEDEELKATLDAVQNKELISESGIEHIVESNKGVVCAEEPEKEKSEKLTEKQKETDTKRMVMPDIVNQLEDDKNIQSNSLETKEQPKETTGKDLKEELVKTNEEARKSVDEVVYSPVDKVRAEAVNEQQNYADNYLQLNVEELSQNDVGIFEDKPYAIEEETNNNSVAKYEEVDETEEESEEFGENTTAPEIETYEEAVVEYDLDTSEKEVADVELEDEIELDDEEIIEDLLDNVEVDDNEKEAQLPETIDEVQDVNKKAPEFVTRKQPTDHEKDAHANGFVPAEPDEDSSEEKAAGNSILEIIGAQTVEEVLMKMTTFEAVVEVMRMAGLESSNLIFGIDYTASNKYQGENCFGGKSLHTIEKGLLNPYQQVLAVYTQVTPKVILSGPTNFAPLIYQSIQICKQAKDYHILVIVADGQVTNERATRRAIVDACKYPISIIVVGVGDGPWDMMRVFDDSLPKRPWDNFHFVEFHQITGKSDNPDLAFAVQSLLEIPDQYKKIKAMGLLNFADDE